MNRPPSRFGAALIQAYTKYGVKQYQVAKRLNRDPRYLNNLEHDRNEPRFTTILMLAKAIGMPPGELVDAAAEMSWAAVDEEAEAEEDVEPD